MSSDRKPWLRVTDPSLILGALATAAFYGIVTRPFFHGSLIARYTTEHAVEYVIVTLFFWGLADVLLKLLALPREAYAARQDWLPPRTGREPVSVAHDLLAAVRGRPDWLLDSRAGRRLVEALTFVTERDSAEGFAEHIRYLSDRDDNRTHESYTLLRFIVALCPILGFLGTVVHFGTALGGLTFDDMGKHLPEVAAHIGMAFDTTTTALAAGMVMTAALFLCQRIEGGVVASIDRLIDRELPNRFEVRSAEVSPFLEVIRTANYEALNTIAANVGRQSDVWSRSIDALFRRFDERQIQEADRWQAALDELRRRHEAYDADRETHLRETFALLDARESEHAARLESMLERATGFRNEIAVLLRTLDEIARGEGRLAETQASLADNLRAIQEVGQLDAALHSLTAAIHLLTTRDRRSDRREAA